MPLSKLKSIPQLSIISRKLKMQGKVVVTTNGVFDLLHVGHVRYLQKAKNSGYILIVGVNSDASVKKIKGNSRPINPAIQRAEVLAALGSVDYVCIFNESTPIKFLSAIKPSVHVKGGDYNAAAMPESKAVMKNGGRIRLINFEKGFSTSGIIETILRKYCK